jgi:hypothetical protein
LEVFKLANWEHYTREALMSAEIPDAGARHQHAEHTQVSSYKKLGDSLPGK